ncbi:lysoplasmalogenase [Anaeromicropila populeti]|uniref:YhhN-like protein n=1 Tax=Anaeromicropila populeti TaxID=37658 RepID=A0A1I6JM20_9FIRM|nr:lysoplasmalogenase [Anaeromicropila populeti]SFR80013.1 YhhN-like protein [Anaeromicropila populeti]
MMIKLKKEPFLLFFVLLLSMMTLIFNIGVEPRIIYVFLKTFTSLLFVSLIVISYLAVPCDKNYFITLLLGFIFALFGDFFLAINNNSIFFILGVASFAIGHIFYSISFYRFTKINQIQLIVFAILAVFTITYITVVDGFEFGSMYPLIVAYTLIITFMTGSAVSLIKHYHSFPWAVMTTILGAIMFYISDLILVHVFYYNNSPFILVPLNLLIYYTGQGILALSVMNGFRKKDILQ